MTNKEKQTATSTGSTNPVLIPISKWNTVSPYPSVDAIRQLRFYNTDNFNSKVVRKIGKRLYLNVPAFYEWVEETNRSGIRGQA